MSDPINYHPHSRFTLHETAYLYPFRDLIWNKTDGPFIDLKVDFPDPANNYADGTAYLRVEDVVEMAHVLGMSTREETEALKSEIVELKARLNELPTKVESYKNELSRTTADFLSSLNSSVSPVVAVVEKPEYSEPSYLTEQSAITEPVWDASDESIARVKRNHPSSGKANGSAKRTSDKPVEPASESVDESPVGKGPDDLSGPIGNATDKSLASILGLGDASK